MSLNYPFWVNDFDRVKDHKLKFPLASKIFQYPVSFWYGERNGKEMEKIDYSIQRLLRRTHPQLPILVVYNMPNRDIGQYSKGGAKTRESYLNFLKGFADGIGDRQVRNRGTLGGSVANNDPSACYPSALLSLKAIVHTNTISIEADEFFTGMFETALEEN